MTFDNYLVVLKYLFNNLKKMFDADSFESLQTSMKGVKIGNTVVLKNHMNAVSIIEERLLIKLTNGDELTFNIDYTSLEIFFEEYNSKSSIESKILKEFAKMG